ncbi:DUF1476 domain-containing protein [Mangrovicoccus algicola]|uniref:DUF1476 domain-containing protein n=1 Tax=Mangrovicoccus algicola TaxID=2771008 RepID=A0A8J7CVS4_9RHOB|nr:DUF1476 domain-containing protein [Mangrovicoccus algicola]MBE3639074.1 DUF1476 domain-containing protein [Mangrovicoccus algicola]
MTTFDDRERAFETMFVRSEEMAFKAIARRDRALARWAGGLLGKEKDALDAYVLEVLRADINDPRHLAVFHKLREDLGDLTDDARIREMMVDCFAEARAELAAGV